MNKDLQGIPERIFSVACGALAQSNTHAVFFDPGKEHWAEIQI